MLLLVLAARVVKVTVRPSIEFAVATDSTWTAVARFLTARRILHGEATTARQKSRSALRARR